MIGELGTVSKNAKVWYGKLSLPDFFLLEKRGYPVSVIKAGTLNRNQNNNNNS